MDLKPPPVPQSPSDLPKVPPPPTPPPPIDHQRKHFSDLLERAGRLKDFAVKNGFDVDAGTIRALNELLYKDLEGSPVKTSKDLAADSTRLDDAIEKLTALTYPTTIDLPPDDPKSEEEYTSFKNSLRGIALAALSLAIVGFTLSVKMNSPLWLVVGNSALALSLGLPAPLRIASLTSCESSRLRRSIPRTHTTTTLG